MTGDLEAEQGDLSSAHIVMVCSANVCRSPVAEQHLRHLLIDRMLTGVTVRSAGVDGMTDQRIDSVMAKLLARDGVSSEDFRARRLEAQDVTGATLILTAERSHKSRIVRQSPQALGRTFTMLEFVALTSSDDFHGPRGGSSERLSALTGWAAARRPYVSLRATELDIRDPHGQSIRRYRHAYAQLRSVSSHIAGIL